jgi:D-tyrosyl-tRNA(Tyr) deacylase
LRAVVQRVKKAQVKASGGVIGKIQKGLVVLLGIEEEDSEEDIKYMAEKICNLRIFEDDENKMNLSLLDIKGELLIVSQFTLYGDCRKGRRPNFMMAAKPEEAEEIYNKFLAECKKYIGDVKHGKFRAHMELELINDGPVTLLIDSKKNF